MFGDELDDPDDPGDDDEGAGYEITAVGYMALSPMSTGSRNTYFGPWPMFFDLTRPATERDEQVWPVDLSVIR